MKNYVFIFVLAIIFPLFSNIVAMEEESNNFALYACEKLLSPLKEVYEPKSNVWDFKKPYIKHNKEFFFFVSHFRLKKCKDPFFGGTLSLSIPIDFQKKLKDNLLSIINSDNKERLDKTKLIMVQDCYRELVKKKELGLFFDSEIKKIGEVFLRLNTE